MDIWIGKIIGQTGPNSWVQVHDFIPAEEEKLAVRGRLVAIVGFQNIPEGQTAAQGREILDRFNELYYGQLEKPALEQLKLAVQGVKNEFDSETELLECVCLVFVNNLVHVVRSVGGVWVQLAAKEGWLVAPDDSQTLVTLTGPLRPGLNLVAGNPTFWQGMSLGVVKASLKNEDPQMITDTLGSMVQGNTKLLNAVGAVVRISEPVAPVVPSTEKTKTSFKLQMPTWLKKPQNIYLTDPAAVHKRRRTMLTGVAFLILLLLLVAGGQYRRKVLGERNSAQNVQLDELLYKYREASAVAELNPARSKQLLTEIQAGLSQLPGSKNLKTDARYMEITSGLPQVLGVATGVKSPAVDLVLDLTLLRSDISGSFLRLLDDQRLALLDTKASRLIIVDPVKKKGDVVAGQENLGVTQAMTSYPGKIEIISNKGIVDCQLSTVNCKTAVAPDAQMTGVVDVGMFGGNIYLLDHTSLWRYQVTDSGFGAGQNWLAESEKPDFSSAQGIAIDGSIWVGKAGGGIEKYVRGVKDNFNLQDVDGSFGQKIGLYTDEDSKKLYIWDGDNGRIVAVLKDSGEFDSQYKIPQAKDLTGFTVDEKAGVIYLLTGNKLWQAKL